MGASTTFCGEVSNDAMAWPNLVVEGLRGRFPGIDIDYVNAAVPGYTTQTSLKNLNYRIENLHPDIVIIYHATNDLSQEVWKLAESQGLTPSSSNNQPSWLAQHMLLWDLAEKNIRIIFAQHTAESEVGRVSLDEKRFGESFRSDLGQLVEAASSGGRTVAVVTFSARLRPEQSLEEKKKSAVSALFYMPFMSLDGLLFGYKRYNEIIREVARNHNAILIEGENLIPGDATHFVDSVHFTDTGSRLMADRVINSLSTNPDFVARLQLAGSSQN
ncbi:MAG: SGNH/GDSL hydrolase family protein [Halioglobus sp.]